MSPYTDDRHGRACQVLDIYEGFEPGTRTSERDSIAVYMWMRAVEWYENRPSAGDTPGERLYACARYVQATMTEKPWRNLSPEIQTRLEAMATVLRPHPNKFP